MARASRSCLVMDAGASASDSGPVSSQPSLLLPPKSPLIYFLNKSSSHHHLYYIVPAPSLTPLLPRRLYGSSRALLDTEGSVCWDAGWPPSSAAPVCSTEEGCQVGSKRLLKSRTKLDWGHFQKRVYTVTRGRRNVMVDQVA